MLPSWKRTSEHSENEEGPQMWPLSLPAAIDSPWLSMPTGHRNHCPTATQSSRLSLWPQRTRIHRPWAEPKNLHFNKQEIWPDQTQVLKLSEERQPPFSAPSSAFNLLNISVQTLKSKITGFLTRFRLPLFPGVLRIKNCYGYIHKWGTIIDDKLKHK